MLQSVVLHLRKLYYVGGNNSNKIFADHPYQRARETIFLEISISNPSLRKKKKIFKNLLDEKNQKQWKKNVRFI